MASNFCPNCGKPLQPNTKFCGNCGAKINDSAAPEINEKQDLSTTTETPIQADTTEPKSPTVTKSINSTLSDIDDKYSQKTFTEQNAITNNLNATKSLNTTLNEDDNSTVENNSPSINKDELKSTIKSKYFNSQGRINRKLYIERSLILYVLCLISMGLTSTGILAIIGIPIIIASAVSNVYIAIQRFHDLNKQGAFVILLFIPYLNALVNLYLWIAKGTDGDNQYGPDPLQNIQA